MRSITFLDQLRHSPARISYLFMVVLLAGVAWLHLATPLLAALLAHLALRLMHYGRVRGKWLTVSLFVVLLSGLVYGLWSFGNHTVRALPEIVDQAVPAVADLARKHEVELPFTDYESLRGVTLESIFKQVQRFEQVQRFGSLAQGAAKQVIFVIAGCVVAISFFLNSSFYLRGDPNSVSTSLYAACCRAVSARFAVFNESFTKVMGAQIIISAINTVFTSIFIIAAHLPYKIVILGVTFLCGLLPVIGNLISNTVIVGIALTVSPRMGLAALVFLVVIHKLEYFLNSKIVGHTIGNPLWLTLLGLVVGERLMGVPGMILAPVVLHYLKAETSSIQVRPKGHDEVDSEPAVPAVVPPGS